MGNQPFYDHEPECGNHTHAGHKESEREDLHLPIFTPALSITCQAFSERSDLDDCHGGSFAFLCKGGYLFMRTWWTQTTARKVIASETATMPIAVCFAFVSES